MASFLSKTLFTKGRVCGLLRSQQRKNQITLFFSSLQCRQWHSQQVANSLAKPCRRYYSTNSARTEKPLRVAVVGGGAAGLSTALHFAPLVDLGYIEGPIDVFGVPTPLRDIGIGLWSTAFDPFQASSRESHSQLYTNLTSSGTWLGSVGYRIPNGRWLMTSHLPVTNTEQKESGLPALLFLREKDMIQVLQQAVDLESEQNGTIAIHFNDANQMKVVGLQENSSSPWSAKLKLGAKTSLDASRLSERDYHLVVAADGMYSELRRLYADHDTSGSNVTGERVLGSMSRQLDSTDNPYLKAQGMHSQELETFGLQDRSYTVFRGNSPVTAAEMGLLDDQGSAISFQTWGEGRSMRFATVPMCYPGLNGSTQIENQVWFITINDVTIDSEPDPVKRRELLLDAFRDWHDPIGRIVRATPPRTILMERAVAHRHATLPVLNFNQRFEQTRHGEQSWCHGDGPCLVFVGDACMTVDPILAQGYSVAMEAAHVLAKSVETACALATTSINDDNLALSLRKELKSHSDTRIERLVCLLQATELVQALGQPNARINRIHTHLLRPLVQFFPNVIKAPIFDQVLKYSLGVHKQK